MSEDSLIDDDQDNDDKVQTTTTLINTTNSNVKSIFNGARSVNLDEHIKLVKQKKEEADELRLQRFQDQLRKKEQKCEQQKLEKLKQWIQLRNRDIDHRSQVEERRKKREEETKVKIEEILRREKEREQKAHTQIKINLRGHASHRPDSIMSMSIDIHSSRRAISAPRLRSNPRDMTNRRGSNDSPVTAVSQDNGDNSTTANTTHQLDPIDEHRRRHRSRHFHDVTMRNEDNSLSGTPRSLASSRSRPMPTSYTYWLNTGDNNNHVNANFMRLTYAATCRSRLSRSVERCPRACRVEDDTSTNNTTLTTNGESQRRVQSINRQHLNETILRLSKPKTIPATPRVHSGSTTPTSGIASSYSSHQLRVSTPPLTSTNHSTSPSTSAKTRRNIPPRPASAASNHTSTSNDTRLSPASDGTPEHSSSLSSSRQVSHRTSNHPKLPLPPSSKPPTPSRSKPPTQRTLMTTSFSSSTVSSTATSTPTTTTTTVHKKNVRRIGGSPTPSSSSSKPKLKTETITSLEITETAPPINNDKENVEETIIVDEHNEEKEEEKPPIVNEPTNSSIEPISIDTLTEIVNPSAKREQQTMDEQEYQRKLSQKIREAQQRKELERQREEELQRQLEIEEYEREQEQIRLAEEQRRVEQERLQRAIEERERENELKRQEELRLQQQREELERKQAEEAERVNRERQERIKKEEEERNERKRRLDLIMRRTRQISPSLKQENIVNKTNGDETNGHHQNQLHMSHSISDNRFPTSLSNENFLNDTTNNESTSSDTSKFKSPLIQNLLNKARNTKSTDNLSESDITTSQIMNETMPDEESATIESTLRSDSSDVDDDDDDDQQDSGINNTTNGHSDSPLSSSTNLNSSHDHPIETAATFD